MFIKNSCICVCYWLPPLAFMFFIYYHSTTTPIAMPVSYPYQDKVVHFVVYAMLAVLWSRAWNRMHLIYHANFYLTVAIATIFGVFVEVRQIYCHRFFELSDIAANLIGAISGTLIFLYLVKRSKNVIVPC